MDGVGRRRHQGGVTRADQNPHQVGQSLFRTNGRDHLGFRIDGHIELAEVEIRDRLADLRDAPARRIPMVARVMSGFRQLLDRHVRRWQVRIAESQVDDVFAVVTGCGLQVVHGGEHVRGQSEYAAKLHAERLPAGVDLSATLSASRWRPRQSLRASRASRASRARRTQPTWPRLRPTRVDAPRSGRRSLPPGHPRSLRTRPPSSRPPAWPPPPTGSPLPRRSEPTRWWMEVLPPPTPVSLGPRRQRPPLPFGPVSPDRKSVV